MGGFHGGAQGEGETMENGSDICFCGDYRSQHKPKCFCGCKEFTFSRKANDADLKIWNKYHANRCFAGLPGCDCYGTFERFFLSK